MAPLPRPRAAPGAPSGPQERSNSPVPAPAPARASQLSAPSDPPPTPSSACPSAPHKPEPGSITPLRVALFVPNLVCYARLVLLAVAAYLGPGAQHGRAVLALFLVNFVLDGADGALARLLGQTSSFGAWLDVATDVASRGLLWLWACPGAAAPLGLTVVLLEALTFVCTHAMAGGAWKQRAASLPGAPAWVAAVMADGFRTPAGALAVAGLMGCPLWAWARSALPGTVWSTPAVGLVVVAGRLLAAGVELWLVGTYLRALLEADAGARRTERGGGG